MARPSDLEEYRKLPRPPSSWCWGPQLKTPSWECRLLGTSAGSSAPGRHEAKGEDEASVRKKWDTSPWVFSQAPSTLIHSPGSRHSLRLWLQMEPELGMKKCCHLVDISWNYTGQPALTGTSNSQGGQLMTAALRKGHVVGIAEINSKQNQLSRSQL